MLSWQRPIRSLKHIQSILCGFRTWSNCVQMCPSRKTQPAKTPSKWWTNRWRNPEKTTAYIEASLQNMALTRGRWAVVHIVPTSLRNFSESSQRDPNLDCLVVRVSLWRKGSCNHQPDPEKYVNPRMHDGLVYFMWIFMNIKTKHWGPVCYIIRNIEEQVWFQKMDQWQKKPGSRREKKAKYPS